MSWYRWKFWRFAWSLNKTARIETGGWVWWSLVGRLMFRVGKSADVYRQEYCDLWDDDGEPWEAFPEGDQLCPHGDDPAECNACMFASDFAADCWRERH